MDPITYLHFFCSILKLHEERKHQQLDLQKTFTGFGSWNDDKIEIVNNPW